MILEGIIRNGRIVLNDGASLPEGTPVTVTIDQEKKSPAVAKKSSKNKENASFFRSTTIDELARAQGVILPCSFNDLLGGWPEEDTDDMFDEAVALWRKEKECRGEF